MTSDPFVCANPHCARQLGVDHVTLITTAHVRRFCSVECIEKGRQAHEREIFERAAEPAWTVFDFTEEAR